ncbi:hypothetical protein [Brevibacillus borstelensis]
MKKFFAITFAVMMVMSVSGVGFAASEPASNDPNGCCRRICCVPY